MRNRRSGAAANDGRPAILTRFGLFMVAALACLVLASFEISAVDPADHTFIRVTVPTGAGTADIAKILVDRGLARNSVAVYGVIVMNGERGRLKAGVYALSRSMPLKTILTAIASGATDTVVVVIPEGFTLQQIAGRLASNYLADRAEFLQVARTQGGHFTFSDGFAAPHCLEGYLFPLTYTVARGSSARSIAESMVGQFDNHVVRRYPKVHDWREVVIVASLVEREAKTDADRPLIASVYYNRLRLGMPLQCDATVQFALPVHKDRLLYSDLQTDSPYNTYLHRGLPPGPICSPGLPSIEAALEPARTDYLFYVAAPGGSHVFSHTLAEQDQAIAAVRARG